MQLKNRTLAIATLVTIASIFLIFVALQLNKMRVATERVTDTIQEVGGVATDTLEQVTDHVDAAELGSGLTEGAKQIGAKFRDKVLDKIDER
jgi:hypothetical protein